MFSPLTCLSVEEDELPSAHVSHSVKYCMCVVPIQHEIDCCLFVPRSHPLCRTTWMWSTGNISTLIPVSWRSAPLVKSVTPYVTPTFCRSPSPSAVTQNHVSVVMFPYSTSSGLLSTDFNTLRKSRRLAVKSLIFPRQGKAYLPRFYGYLVGIKKASLSGKDSCWYHHYSPTIQSVYCCSVGCTMCVPLSSTVIYNNPHNNKPSSTK